MCINFIILNGRLIYDRPMQEMAWSAGLLILLLLCTYFQPGTPVLSKAAMEQTKTMMKNLCKGKTKVSQSVLTKLKDGVFEDDQKLKCYVHCCFGMMKTMKKDKITVDDALKQIDAMLPLELREPSKKQLLACKDVAGTDACDKAFNFLKCAFETDPNNMLIPT